MDGAVFLSGDDECACGSGQTYELCCAPLMHTTSADARKHCAAAEWGAAERQYRAEFVRYLGWVHKHTVPALQSGMPASAKIVALDLDALEEIAGNIATCIFREGGEERIVPVLDRLESFVPIAAYQHRARYLRAFWRKCTGDSSGARSDLELLPEEVRHKHRESMELWVDLFAMEAPILDLLAECDRILELSDGAANRLQYRGLKAIFFEWLGDRDRAVVEISEALAERPEPDGDGRVDPHERLWLGRSHQFRWLLARDEADFRAALGWVESALRDWDLSDSGRAHLMAEIGEWKLSHADAPEAAQLLEEAVGLESSSVALIKLAEARVELGQFHEAEKLLASLTLDEVEAPLRLELLAVRCALAMATGNRDSARSVAEVLPSLEVRGLYYQRERDQLRLEVESFLASDSGRDERRGVAFLRRFLRSVELKPNFMGIGLNLNRLFGLEPGDDE